MANWEELKDRYTKTYEFKKRAEQILERMKGADPKTMEGLELELETLGRSFSLPEPEVKYPKQDPNFSKALRLTALLELVESKNANYLTLLFLHNEITELLSTLSKEEIDAILKQANGLRAADKNSAGKGLKGLYYAENIDLRRPQPGE